MPKCCVKVGLLQDAESTPLAGRMIGLLDLCSQLPRHLWYEDDAEAHDQRFWPTLQTALRAGSLLIFDLGFTNFQVFADLTKAQVTFITRAKANLPIKLNAPSCVQPRSMMSSSDGSGEQRQQLYCHAFYQGKWYRYLSNELEPSHLPVPYLVALYRQRWRIEDAYNIVKRLLGLAFFWCGAQNAVEMQLKAATWLLYAVLVDLTDAVAETLNMRFARLSMEMVYRSLYFSRPSLPARRGY